MLPLILSKNKYFIVIKFSDYFLWKPKIYKIEIQTILVYQSMSREFFLEKWCKENCLKSCWIEHRFDDSYSKIIPKYKNYCFINEQDATLFKLML